MSTKFFKSFHIHCIYERNLSFMRLIVFGLFTIMLPKYRHYTPEPRFQTSNRETQIRAISQWPVPKHAKFWRMIRYFVLYTVFTTPKCYPVRFSQEQPTLPRRGLCCSVVLTIWVLSMTRRTMRTFLFRLKILATSWLLIKYNSKFSGIAQREKR